MRDLPHNPEKKIVDTVSKTILVVEDDCTVRETVVEALIREHYKTLTAEDGQQALELVQEFPNIDLIVLDLMLPKIHGLDVCRILREQDIIIPILMLSARDSERERVTGLELGANDYLKKPFGMRELIARCQAIVRYQDYVGKGAIVRSLEFAPEHREAGTSILTYFNHILRIKYPDVKVKVKIEQNGLVLRMIIHTPTGYKEIMEETLEEYGMVVSGRLKAELFLSDPLEVIALKNKLEIAHLELRQARDLLSFTQTSSQKQIDFFESEVNKLYCLIEQSLQSKDIALGVIEDMTRQEKKSYDFRGAKFGGGFGTKGGFQVGGSLTDATSINNLSEAALQIQDLLKMLQYQGLTLEEAQKQVSHDLAKQAGSDPSTMGKLVQWGSSLADTAGKTTVSEVVKEVVKFALKLAGVSMS